MLEGRRGWRRRQRTGLLAVMGVAASAMAQQGGSIVTHGDTQVSAMMMFLGNDQNVYILDKSEGNAAQINGHPAWGAVYNIETGQSEVMDIFTNTFCASGMHLPNGSFVTFGGNGAVGPGAAIGSDQYPGGGAAIFDQTYQDYDGRKSIRLLNPCTGDLDSITSDPNCQWFDNATFLSMQKLRWYSAAEALGDGSIAIIGGFVSGGYVNRNLPNTDPANEGGGAEPTTEFFPSKGPPQVMQFMIDTSGLNAYAHTYLMPDGQLFLQANLSTVLWDPNSNQETPLPPMPNGVVRVYPASGATAMLPLTPGNNYTPTMLFCGGSDMPADGYGNYTCPAIETWNVVASQDCQRITPEPADGSAPAYVQDDNMIEPRTMGQFILLPDQTLLVINGGTNGTAGYSQSTGVNPDLSTMPFWESLASGPVMQPAIYNPNAPAGQRWSNTGLGTSNIPRLYHSSALLLPDASVLVAGSNPNLDVNTSAIFPTTYTAERFYPPYFSAPVRPAPTGMPSNLTYGGAPFDITIPASSYSGSSNDAAANTTIMVIRPGFTTHAMNMGQRALQLNNTYTVNNDGSIVLHVAQVPPNPNILTPGPCIMFVVMNGIPSNGTMLIVGNGQIGPQPTQAASALPDPQQAAANVTGTANGSGSSSGNNNGNGGNNGSNSANSSGTNGAPGHTGIVIGSIVGAILFVGIIGAAGGIYLARRRRAQLQGQPRIRGTGYGPDVGAGGAMGVAGGMRSVRHPDGSGSGFVPLRGGDDNAAWNASTTSLDTGLDTNREGTSTPFTAYYPAYADYAAGNGSTGRQTPYKDDYASYAHGATPEFDPYGGQYGKR